MDLALVQNDVEMMDCVYQKPDTLTDTRFHYCPGCGHGVVHRVLMEAIDELHIQDQTIGVAPVGCSVFAYHYMNIDMQQAAHGRASAVATGIKRILPDKYVFSYQGDGDLAAIGTAETIHTCNRGENILMVFINNAIYGMTGGQMAPTTLLGMKTSTSPIGRTVETAGYPLKISDIVAMLPGVYYVSRHSVHTPNAVRQLKKAITKSFQYQKEKKGTCFIEVVSNCPSGWKMTPLQANKWMEENMFSVYPPGELKNEKGKGIMTHELLIAGFGGQGVLSMGMTLAYAGMIEKKEISWMPSYGPEMRGGTANCIVIVSDKQISSPIVTTFDTVIALNQPSLDKFEKAVKPGGTLVYDSTNIIVPPTRADITIFPIPASDEAVKMNNTRIMNMIVLGSFIAQTEVVSIESVMKALHSVLPERSIESVMKALHSVLPERHHHLLPLNEQALRRGMELTAGVEVA
ncbi:MAG: korB [Bacteroidetes bacterium]|nr:korB [Bacteroidota bacterium]